MAESTGNPPSANDREGAQGGADASHPATSAVKDAASGAKVWEEVRRMTQTTPSAGEIWVEVNHMMRIALMMNNLGKLTPSQMKEVKKKLGREYASALAEKENERLASLLYHSDEALRLWKTHVDKCKGDVKWERNLCSEWSNQLRIAEAQAYCVIA